MKVNPNVPLYYVRTGRPVDLITTEPVVKYRVRYSNGNEEVVTQEDLDTRFTNEQPRYRFDTSLAAGFLRVVGNERSVAVKIRRKFGDFPGQDLNVSDVWHLYEHLGRWLTDQKLP